MITEQMVATMKLVRDVYTARSIAAHTGKLDQKLKKIGNTADLLQAGESIAAQAIQKLIREGEPDWEQLCIETNWVKLFGHIACARPEDR